MEKGKKVHVCAADVRKSYFRTSVLGLPMLFVESSQKEQQSTVSKILLIEFYTTTGVENAQKCSLSHSVLLCMIFLHMFPNGTYTTPNICHKRSFQRALLGAQNPDLP